MIDWKDGELEIKGSSRELIAQVFGTLEYLLSCGDLSLEEFNDLVKTLRERVKEKKKEKLN